MFKGLLGGAAGLLLHERPLGWCIRSAAADSSAVVWQVLRCTRRIETQTQFSLPRILRLASTSCGRRRVLPTLQRCVLS
jgi:hypothetical protein